jgi:hypothetical protein
VFVSSSLVHGVICMNEEVSMLLEKVSSVALRELLAAVAGPRQWSDTRESWLARAARRSGITFRKAKSLYYGEIADPEHPSAQRLRDAAARLGRTEAQALAEKFESVASALRVSDQDFHGADISALVDAARALRGLGLPRDDSATVRGTNDDRE